MKNKDRLDGPSQQRLMRRMGHLSQKEGGTKILIWVEDWLDGEHEEDCAAVMLQDATPYFIVMKESWDYQDEKPVVDLACSLEVAKEVLINWVYQEVDSSLRRFSAAVFDLDTGLKVPFKCVRTIEWVVA